MKYIMLLALTLVMWSCVKEDLKPQLPLAPQPIITDSTLVDSTLTIKEENSGLCLARMYDVSEMFGKREAET